MAQILFPVNTAHPPMKRHHAFLNLSLLGLAALFGGAASGLAVTKTSNVATGDWNTAGTWSPSGVPASTDDVTIRATDSITVSATPASAVNSILINGGGRIQLTINSGVTLTVMSGFTHYAPSGGSSTVALNGILDVGGAYASNGANGKPVILRFGPGASCAIAGTYTTVPGSQTDMSNGGTLSLGGSPAWTDSGVTFTSGTGTVVYNRSGIQTVQAAAYNNLILFGSGTKTLGAGTTTAYGTLSMQGTATFALGGHTLTYGAGAILEYKGSGPQTTSTAEFPATMPAAVMINNPSGVTLDATKTINKSLTVASGSVFNNGGYAITMGSGCNFSVNGGAAFNLTGTSGMVTVSGAGTTTFDPDSTVNYGGTTQTVSSQTYGKLTIGAGTKTFTSPVTASGTLALDSSAVASLASGGSYTANTLTIGGVNEAPGTWGCAGSGAANIDSAHFSGTGVLSVTSGPTSITSSTTLASSLDPSTYGSPVTFTATVTGSGPTPTGTVTLREGGATLGTSALDGSGVATFVINTLSAAGSPHSITAVYGGDANFAGSSGTVTLRVLPRLSGSLASASLSGYKGSAIKVVFVARDSDGKALGTNEVQLATTDGGGAFSYAIGVPPNTATLSLKPRFYLRKKFNVPATLSNANEATLDITGTFLGGDADGNNQVDGNDYAWLRALWGQTSNTQYDINGDGKLDADDFPDLNGDGVTDALDYAILKDGWYHQGDDE